MEIVIGKPGSGKSTALIELSHKTGQTIVCHTPDDARWLMFEAKVIKKPIPEPVTYSQFIMGSKLHGKNLSRGVLIDNVDLFFASQFGSVTVNGFSVSIGPEDKVQQL